jgi:ATP-binding cassette, subfamily A (ABC1), member 3
MFSVLLSHHPAFANGIAGSLPLLLVLAYIYTALSIVRNIVMEKELRLKEALRMMGVGSWVHWTAWFIKSFIFIMISLIGVMLILSVRGVAVSKNVKITAHLLLACLDGVAQLGNTLKNSNYGIVIIFFVLFNISTIFFCFAVSSFFATASVASAAGGLLFFMVSARVCEVLMCVEALINHTFLLLH